MIGSMANWTPELDALLEKTIRTDGGSYADAVRVITEATRGRFVPHATTCLRRLRVLDARRASTRVDTATSRIPPRVRAPFADRSMLPTVQVLSLPFDRVERASPQEVVDEVLFAETPGWRWEIVDDGAGDALACARHRATLRGDDLIVLERAPSYVVVAVRGRTDRLARQLVLVVVRHIREAWI
jgi:hypothetical protein